MCKCVVDLKVRMNLFIILSFVFEYKIKIHYFQCIFFNTKISGNSLFSKFLVLIFKIKLNNGNIDKKWGAGLNLKKKNDKDKTN